MTALVRSELLKIRSTRTTAGLVATMLALVLLFVLLGGLVSRPEDLVGAETQRSLLGVGSVAQIFAALAGILVVTSEFRYGTIRATLVVTPRRLHVLAAKLVAALLAGLAFGVVGEALAFGIGRLILHERGIPVALDSGDLLLLGLGTLAGAALWGAIGAGLGATVRGQVAAIVAVFAWNFVVESLLFAFVPSVGRFLPGQAQSALVGSTASHLLSPAAGGAVFLGWTLALAAAGALVTARRDVG